MSSKLRWLFGLAVLGATVAQAQQDTKIVCEGSTTVGPIAKAFAEYYMAKHTGVNITISESGSGNGAKAIINGTCDIANMSRKMKDEEMQAAKDKGRNIMEHVVAMDGLAVVVHPGNPVAGLTKEQVKQIFTGEITNWKEVGGPDKKIVVISRDTNSGTYETFQTIVTKSDRLTERAEYVGSNGAVRQRIMTTEGAIGYVGLAFLEGVKTLEVNGVKASPETVLDKSYCVSRALYMYTIGEPKDGTHLKAFVSLYTTPDGKKLVEEAGFVPVK